LIFSRTTRRQRRHLGMMRKRHGVTAPWQWELSATNRRVCSRSVAPDIPLRPTEKGARYRGPRGGFRAPLREPAAVSQSSTLGDRVFFAKPAGMSPPDFPPSPNRRSLLGRLLGLRGPPQSHIPRTLSRRPVSPARSPLCDTIASVNTRACHAEAHAMIANS
jgi:hypothetical protein